MIKEAIILAGGLGTRLRSVVTDMPKCMAPVAGKPFLYYVITHLQKQGVDKFIFSLGYKHEMVTAWLNQQYPLLYEQTIVEEEPMGTGGAIKLACDLAFDENVLVLNGDTLFAGNLKKLSEFHLQHHADCTLALKPMTNFSRYGAVTIDQHQAITAFHEKKHVDQGLINAGVYALNAARFLQEPLPEKFSFEKDYLEKNIGKRKLFGLAQDSYFIDIGIPEDYAKAQEELKDGSHLH